MVPIIFQHWSRRFMKEILFELDTNLPASLQAQLREKVVNAILSRALQPGERLPSSRSLSKHLNVARNTVTLAYQALADDGYLTPKPRSGYVVNEDAPVNPLGFSEKAKPTVEKIEWGHRVCSKADKFRVVDKPLNWREYEFPFVYGQADFNLFSHSEWRDCARQALGARDFGALAGDFGFSDDPMLVDYIASHSLPQRGIYKDPRHVLVTLGAQNALFLVAELMIQPDKTVGLEEPCYPDIRNIVSMRTNNIEYFKVDEGGLILDEEKLSKCDLVFVTPSHQSPTTATMPIERRKELLRLSDKHDFVIVEDDYEFEMNFLAPPSPALKSMDEKARVIYIGSFSKSLFPGLRLGYLAGPDILIHEARRLRHLMFRHPPGHSQRTAAYFLALGHYGAQMRRLKRSYSERRKIMHKALLDHSLMDSSAAQFGGTSFWIGGPKSLDSNELARRLLDKSVLIDPGSTFFGQSNAPSNYFRIAYSSIDSEKIPGGIAQIAETIDEMTA
ncbi:MAG: PLP-dependent aminotransferase family protein [Pseudomonadota bacterium]